MPLYEQASFESYSSLGTFQGGPATVFVVVDPGGGYGDWIVLNCSPWNTTYTVDIYFSSSKQHITVAQIQDANPVGVDLLQGLPYGTILDFTTVGPGQSYQAIMECLGRVLVGSIQSDGTVGLEQRSGNVLLTDMAYTKELFPIFNRTTYAGQSTYNRTLEALRCPHFNRSLADVIEELFQNMTLSLFSSQAFLGNKTLPTNITFEPTSNIYT
ncbi:hypothetical protein B0H66DRAFT_198945 [Apodospora peruviana]|uniref:Uncharacterized protein n=1 Tax=Apodospora peruviana TaxID=516989 RepID=A0AAE0M820_9PEZI|nr:hypothetical protein B0H66DRAFT_198945 [Apodospora peruviana]